MRPLIILLLIGGWNFGQTQSNNLQLPLQNPDSVRNELTALFTELKIKHPGFYRYNEKQEFDTYIDSVINTIQSPISELEILQRVKPIIAKIGCLHTGIHLSEIAEQQLNDSPNCLPFALHKIKDKVYVWKVFGDESAIKIGDEIKKINGRDIGDIYATLLQNIPMDGYNKTGKLKILQYTFAEWYRTIIEINNRFIIELTNGNSYEVKGLKSDEILSYSDIINQPMTFKIIDDVALIKIPSFANSYLKSHQQKFDKEIKSYLETIQEAKIEKLLIDLRGNTGGSDSNPAHLASFFFEQPYHYWSRIEITEAVAKDVSGIKQIFYGKPKYVNGTWRWSNKGLFSKEFKFTNPQNSAKSAFTGQVFILTDGMCFSSCSDFVAIMQSNRKAVIIGEETGGGYQGNTSGLIPSVPLECGLVVDIPLLKYFNAVPSNDNYGRGTVPDLALHPTLEELDHDEIYLKRVIKQLKKDKND